MSPTYSLLAFLCITVFLGGCAESPQHPSNPPVDGEPCFRAFADTQRAVIEPGQYVLRNPLNASGHMGNGKVVYFVWQSTAADLRSLNLTAEWQAPAAGQEKLRMEIDDADPENPSWQASVVEGVSPLRWSLAVNGTDEFGPNLRVVLRVAWEDSPVGTVALAEQEVRMTLTQTYAC